MIGGEGRDRKGGYVMTIGQGRRLDLLDESPGGDGNGQKSV